MESLVNYSSEDEAEMENNTRKRDESSKNRDGRDARRSEDAWPGSGSQSEVKKARKDDTNYESVQMDMSEDSDDASSKDGKDAASPKPKSRSHAERRRSHSAENERETSRYKSSKEHRHSSRDHREKERDRERDRDRDRDRPRHRDRHSERKKKDSRREREREKHRRRSSSRERRRRSSSRESRRERRRSRSHSRSHGRSRKSPEMKSSPSASVVSSATVVVAAVAAPVAPVNPPPVAAPKPSSPTLIPTVSLPMNSEQAKPERYDWRTQQRVQQLEKMGIDFKKSETAAIELPSYYNPGVVNPSRYAEQMQKRKLLWSHKKADNVEQAAAKWETAKFSQDQDGKVASKFMRLMGIKDPPKAGGGGGGGGSGSGVDLVKKQEELFSSMEQQYEVARQVTHTMRGVGLGFSSQSRPF
ncbi:arginine/serine-rich coiled-coil protein 2 isoform X1 [Phlebotomus argentipes]|uniref:arginine/serine-rich coiled-coil protein 2 isoform X1 n=2 Tax=Phlebotomus argentipes TaxID=94469 RepID=UPI002893398F|nr:arginine/serine-rich coiled-coil protein 2 isoform X1 [Phlebotomus argentipes]